MATPKVKRSVRSVQPKRIHPHLRLRAYETLFHLNRGFATTIINLDRLSKLDIFNPDYLLKFRDLAEELRAKTNYGLTEVLREREFKDAGEIGRLTAKREEH